MTSMRPPQHGHGGRASSGSTDAVSTTGGATPSSWGRVRGELAGGVSEQAVMTDAVEALWENVDQEAADELASGQRHQLLLVGDIVAIILVAQCQPGLAEADEVTVRDGDPVGVARQIGEHRLGPCERRFGIDDPVLLPDWGQVSQEGTAAGECRKTGEEAEPPRVVQRHQPGQEQAADKSTKRTSQPV
jgi:hypothetical protein